MEQDHLVERIAALETELRELKAATSRREMFKKLAVAGAGAVAGAALASAAPASADDGFALELGAISNIHNTATTRTLLTYTGAALTPGPESAFLEVLDDS